MVPDAAKLSILVVEDEFLLRMVAVDMLEEAGFHVIEAVSGDEGLATLNSGTLIAGLFTDVQMPGEIDGFALAKITHEMHPTAVIVIVSGLAAPNETDLPPGATFLGKPYNNRVVLNALDQMIGRLT